MEAVEIPDRALVEQLLEVIRTFATAGLAPATGGNFSARVSTGHFLITRSGADKSRVLASDLLECDLNGSPLRPGERPSAETPIHAALYRIDPRCQAVMHTHSVAATVLSRKAGEAVRFSGYEMQKAIAGQDTHEGTLSLPILENTQDMSSLYQAIVERQVPIAGLYGFLLKGHGLYAWGGTLAEAKRHAEGFQFLLECELQSQILEGKR